MLKNNVLSLVLTKKLVIDSSSVDSTVLVNFFKTKTRLLFYWLIFFSPSLNNLSAQNFTLNTTIDAADVSPGDGVCLDVNGDCSLRAAIQESNALGGPHIVVMPAGVYLMSISGVGEDLGLTGDFDVTANITLSGAGAENTIIEADSLDRVLDVLTTGTLVLNHLTVHGGYINVDFGGGIRNAGSCIIDHCHITANVSRLRDETQFGGGFGGGISNTGQLTLTYSTVFCNEAQGGRGVSGFNGGGGGGSSPGMGAGIYNDATGNISISNCTISGNTAIGGKHSSGSVNAGVFGSVGLAGSGPTAGTGGASGGGAGTDGGEYSGGGGGGSSCDSGGTGGQGGYGAGGGGRGARSCANDSGEGGTSTFGGGTGGGACCSYGAGGGSGAGLGGGIFNNGGTIEILNTTIAYNSAFAGMGANAGWAGWAWGGASGEGYGPGILNRSGTVSMNNTLVANNVIHNDVREDDLVGRILDEDLYGTFNSTDGHNLIFNPGPGTVLSGETSGNITGEDPFLLPLRNYGGHTYTHRIDVCPNSPAIDAASDAVAPAVDQRNFPRVDVNSIANITDIGAYESFDTLFRISGSHIDPCASLSDGSATVNVLVGAGPFIYEWNDPSLQTTPTASDLDVGIYTVIVTDTNNCKIDTTFNLTNSGNGRLNLGSDTTLCYGETLDLTVANYTTATYIWSDGSTGFSLTVSSPGIYWSEMNDLGGCIVRDTILVDYADPNVQANALSSTICLGDSTLIYGSGAETYLWDLWIVDSTYFSPTSSAMFHAVGTDEFGCFNIDSIAVTVNGNPDVTITHSDTIVCDGETVTLSGNGAVSYAWSVGNISDSVAFTPHLGNMLYELVGLDANGCRDTARINVLVNPLPIVGINATSEDVCDGSSVTLSGSDASTYTWNNGVINGVPFVPLTTLLYEVIGTDLNGCMNAMELEIRVHPIPEVSFVADSLYGCSPLEVMFTNLSTPRGENCSWSFGNGNSLNGCQSVSSSFTSGTYDVSLSVTSDYGCSNSITYANYLIVIESVRAEFSSSPNKIQVDDPTVNFENLSSNSTRYLWSIEDGELSTEENPEHTFPNVPEQYDVRLIAFDENTWCPDTITQTIRVNDVELIYVPNAFTPDGDEYNNTFKPIITSGIDPYDYHLKILNRWGEVIFESFNYEFGWDGTYGGSFVQDGVYVWEIIYKSNSYADRKNLSGHVTILR